MIGEKPVNTLTDAAFGEWLRRKRRDQDWTQNELASRTSCSPITIRKIEGGDLKPSRQLAEIFARVFEIPQSQMEAFVKFARSGVGDDFLKPAPPAAPSAAQPAPQASLPAQVNELIGRKHDITALMALLRQPAVRLVTLTGAPGTGKTRLGIAVGEALLDEFADGVFFVPLANIVEPEQVVPAIAQTLGLREASMGDARPMRRELHVFLRSRHALLILDNFEQVIEAAPEISEMLSAAPRVKAIVTSREVLRVYGEREFPTAPLPLPDVLNLPPLLLREVPSIRLFVERAQAVKLDFLLTPDNAASVAQICAFLDGLPLAIEMAAAQIRRMPPARLLQQLQSRATSLSAGRRDLSPRQQTLRRAIEWSYDLLNAEERAAFQALSVFAGGFSADGALAVLESVHTQLLLDSLVDKSLLQHVILADGSSRYAMLETLRDFARERLDAAGNDDTLRRKHAEFFAEFARAHVAKVRGDPDQRLWIERFEREKENFRAALGWAAADLAGRGALLAHMADKLFLFWENRSYFSEGLRWLELALQAEQAPTLLRGRLLNWLGKTRSRLGDLPGAEAISQNALVLQKQLDDEAGQARSLQQLGILMGMASRLDEARSFFEQALVFERRFADSVTLGALLNNLAIVASRQGDLDRAEALNLEGIEIKRKTGNELGLGHSLHGLAAVAQRKGQQDRAAQLYRESLAIRHRVGDRRGTASSLEGVAAALAALGEADQAAILVGGAEALREALNTPLTPDGLAEYQDVLRQLQSRLGAAVFAARRAEGREMPLGDLIAKALNA